MQPGQYEKESLEKVKMLIEGAPEQRFTIPRLSRLAGMSNTRFRLAFRALYGLNVFAFAQQKRMELAAGLILKDHPLKQVAGRCGFKHVSHFSRAFTRTYGLTTMQFKKQKK